MSTDQTTDRHVVYAVTDTDEKIALTTALAWRDACARWNRLDTARLRDNLPGIRYLAIRHADDPGWNTARRATPLEGLVLRQTRAQTAETAARVWAAEHGYSSKPGGWIYRPSGEPECQGWSTLARSLERSRRIVKRDARYWVETTVPMSFASVDERAATATAGRSRLTPHQREVFSRILRRASSSQRDGWVDAREIGSRGGVAHLVEKGYVESRLLDDGRINGLRPIIKETAQV